MTGRSRHAASSDGVDVVVHELAGANGRPLVLLAHATGFHGHAYLPVATHLGSRFHTFALDFRGHGDTTRPPDWTASWDGYGADAVAAARAVAAVPGHDGGIVGFGHSMGGAALLMAALAEPDLFRLLVLFEPIVVPTDRPRPTGGPQELSDGARRRRPVFDSFDAAIANYASKPPMDAFDPDALDAYVRHGFRREGDHVRLKCEPDTEADTFDNGGNHRTFDRLGEIETPVVVLAGRSEELRPSSIAPELADAIPHGRFVREDHMDHFGPMTHPAEIAAIIADRADAPTG